MQKDDGSEVAVPADRGDCQAHAVNAQVQLFGARRAGRAEAIRQRRETFQGTWDPFPVQGVGDRGRGRRAEPLEHRPQVYTRVVEVDTPAGQQGLLERDIDIAVVRLSTPARHLRTQPWRRDSFVIALPAGHPAAGSTGPVDLARFADEPWVWLRRDISPDYHDQLMATCHSAGFTPDMRHIANSIATQLAMVACGLGVTLVPNVAVRSALPPAATYLPLTSPAELVELSLVTRDSPYEPLVREFLRIALTHPHDTA